MKPVQAYTATGIALAASTETDLLANSTHGAHVVGADVVDIVLSETASVLVDTVTVYLMPAGSISAPLSTTTSLASGGKRHIRISGYPGKIRVTGNSTTGGASADVNVLWSDSEGGAKGFELAIDGVVQAQSSGGTISGNFSASGGTNTLNSTGATAIDASTSTTIAGTAGSLVLGRTAIAPSFPGGLTIAAAKTIDTTAAGTLKIGTATANGMTLGAAGFANSNPGGITIGDSKAVTGGATALSVDTAGALHLGASATSVDVGSASVALSVTGGLSVPSGKNVTGAGAMAVEADAAATLTVGGASNAMVIGQAGKVATVNGDADFQGAFKGHAVDAGVAGTTGTATAYFGTFTLSSGNATFTLTNNKVTTSSLCFVSPLSNGATAAYVQKVVPTANTLTVTFSGAVGADTKCAFMVVNPGA